MADTFKMNRLASIFTLSLLYFTHAVTATVAGDKDSHAAVLRVEEVGANALGPSVSAKAKTYTRVVAKANNGKYLVALYSNVGILRMQGAYLDSMLTVEDGIFTYYHPNGRLESKGAYRAGVKSGTWLRYGLDGAQLAERNYASHSVHGLVQRTTTASLGDAQMAERAGAADRRDLAPVEF